MMKKMMEGMKMGGSWRYDVHWYGWRYGWRYGRHDEKNDGGYENGRLWRYDEHWWWRSWINDVLWFQNDEFKFQIIFIIIFFNDVFFIILNFQNDGRYGWNAFPVGQNGCWSRF